MVKITFTKKMSHVLEDYELVYIMQVPLTL